MEEKEKVPDHSDYVKKYLWLVRPCDDYVAEARECKYFKARFHQYFIYGTFTDCSSLVKDAQGCEKCILEHDDEHCKNIIINETQRRLKRQEAHMKNDVWEKREKPPDDWNKELPQWWLEENKDSLFKKVNKEFEEYITLNEPKKKFTLCVIL